MIKNVFENSEAKIFKQMQDCKHEYFDRKEYDYQK